MNRSRVPQATGSWAATKAAYRFWDNPRVSPEASGPLIGERLGARIPPKSPILAVQDTTALDLTTHPATRGWDIWAHRRKVGLWRTRPWPSRPTGYLWGASTGTLGARPCGLGQRKDRNKKATAEKESQRWIDALTATEAALPVEQTVVATVADREADFYDLFAAERRDGSHLLIPRQASSARPAYGEPARPGLERRAGSRGDYGGDPSRARPPGSGRALTVRFAAVSLAPPLTRRVGDRLPDPPRDGDPGRGVVAAGGSGAGPVVALDDLGGLTLADAQRVVLLVLAALAD